MLIYIEDIYQIIICICLCAGVGASRVININEASHTLSLRLLSACITGSTHPETQANLSLYHRATSL